jgi:hypothetical protein
MREVTTQAIQLWLPLNPTASLRTRALLTESGFRDNPLFRLHPHESVPGWDDEWHELKTNGDGVKKSPAHFGFSWLLYTLTDDPRKWVVFAGATGMGKTHLACVLGTVWILRQKRAGMIVVWPDVLRRMRGNINQSKAGVLPNRESLKYTLDCLISVPFLVLDDIATKQSEWTIEQLFLVLNGRIGKPTIIVMNRALNKFQESLRATGLERGITTADRLGTGEGGNVAASIIFWSKKGSYRAK